MLTKNKENQILTVDLHEYTVTDAKKKLTFIISKAPKGTREIVVIHGYHRGTALKEMVRKEFKNKRVARKIIGLNQGITSLILNSD